MLGPLFQPEGAPTPPEGSPISRALRRIGVERGDAHDEFEAVGLLAHRDTNDWTR